MTQTTLMSIPGQIDPVPVARDITPRADGRVDLIVVEFDLLAIPIDIEQRQAQLFEPGPVTVHRGIHAQFGK